MSAPLSPPAAPAYLLLDVTDVGGVVRRYATAALSAAVTGGDAYAAGLADAPTEMGAESVSVTIVDPSVDWPAVVGDLDGGDATLRWWRRGSSLLDATDLVTGEIRVGSWGARDEAVSLTIALRPGATLGTQVPDALAIVGETTFPTAGASDAGDDQDRWYYPVVFGYPGYRGDALDPYPVVPIPLAQYGVGTSIPGFVVAEDGALDITEVRLRNDETGGEAAETAMSYADLLGRRIRMANLVLDRAPTPTVGDAHAMYAAYYPTGGGGPRSAYDVVVYLARRWGPSSVDWAALPAVRDTIGAYQVDTWIDTAVSDPWAWLTSALLPDLPVELRTSSRGVYLVDRRHVSDPSRRVGTLDIDAGDGARAGAVAFSADGPYNEFVAQFRPDRVGAWLASVVLTGGDGVESARALGATVDAVATTRSAACTRSRARYGPRPAPPVDLDWTWDTGTALEVLAWRATRDAIPARIASYVVRGDGLREGDEVLLTDTARGFAAAPAIVDGPPVFGAAGITVTLRIPG